VAYANDPSSTLGIKYIRDRLGRLEQAERHTYRVTAPNMSDGNRVSCATLTYNDAGQPLTEAYSEGTLATFSIEWTYDTYLRRQTVTARNGGASLQAATSAYDTAGRLSSVSDGTYSATYAYHPNSSLLNTVTFKQNTTPALTTTRTYDKLNRLQQIGSAPSGASAKGNGVPSK
jgi:hypothetical protein